MCAGPSKGHRSQRAVSPTSEEATGGVSVSGYSGDRTLEGGRSALSEDSEGPHFPAPSRSRRAKRRSTSVPSWPVRASVLALSIATCNYMASL